jgi:SAM-dependent methyltransferase
MTDPLLFDRDLLRRRQQRAARLGQATFLLDRVVGDLAERLAVVLRRFEVAVDLATPTDAVAQVLAASPAVGTILRIVPDESEQVPPTPDPSPPLPSGRGGRGDAAPTARSAEQGEPIGGAGANLIVADAEALPLRDESTDLVVSGLALQWINDLPGTLIQIRRALRPDGLFLAALVGGETLTELRQAFAAAEAEIEGGVSPRVTPFADVRDIGMLLQRAGFALPVTDVDRLVVRYSSPFDLLIDLRHMGATNVLRERRRTPLRRATLWRTAEIYERRFADPDGRIRATFDIVWLSGWAPHESQQKPLRPGSATHRLADALGTREISTGEKAG